MKSKIYSVIFTLLTLSLMFSACGRNRAEQAAAPAAEVSKPTAAAVEVSAPAPTQADPADMTEDSKAAAPEKTQPEPVQETVTEPPKADVFDLSAVPPFAGHPYTPVHNNVPYFMEDEVTAVSFEQYAPLDALGRCGVTAASIGPDLMPTEERGSIGMVKPSGWHTVKYDCVDGKYLYNRCHLIGYQLTGENANTSNLITGTRYLNIEGMLPFENMVADYIKETGNHVMYRSTPVFEGNNLLAAGVLLEGLSVEDAGDGICFCVFAYNVQPGIVLDYTNGDSYSAELQENTDPADEIPQQETEDPSATGREYILNKNTKKFHYPDCPSVKRMKEKNKEYYTGSREDLIAQGYDPCKNCNP